MSPGLFPYTDQNTQQDEHSGGMRNVVESVDRRSTTPNRSTISIPVFVDVSVFSCMHIFIFIFASAQH